MELGITAAGGAENSWGRAELGIDLGIGKGFQLAAALPFALRANQDTRALGLTDGRFGARWYGRAREDLTVGGGVGTSLPLGAIGDAESLRMGTGTFVPYADAQLLWQPSIIGVYAGISARLPLYRDSTEYLSGHDMDLSVGAMVRPVARLVLIPALSLAEHGVDENRYGPLGGAPRQQLDASLLASVGVTRGVVLQASSRGTLARRGTSDDAYPTVSGTLGISWTISP